MLKQNRTLYFSFALIFMSVILSGCFQPATHEEVNQYISEDRPLEQAAAYYAASDPEFYQLFIEYATDIHAIHPCEVEINEIQYTSCIDQEVLVEFVTLKSAELLEQTNLKEQYEMFQTFLRDAGISSDELPSLTPNTLVELSTSLSLGLSLYLKNHSHIIVQ